MQITFLCVQKKKMENMPEAKDWNEIPIEIYLIFSINKRQI